ncbi:hypothetical protein PMAYCL1PPCAC_19193 [Pristionchus mayeri]|uniref:DUF229 domain containing protein n=1 Tax=Pristionchus mayeri TaxID=1317129 RepID=A0AAN5CR27_9BILA|nr:hypothetical protein PMAYCL1PPCAC_19193 [Pristionchus mayeri]
MRLPKKFWRNLLLVFTCISFYIFYVFRNNKTAAAKFGGNDKFYRNDNAGSAITITILGQDDGSRRDKAGGVEKGKSMTCNIPKLEMNASDVSHFFHDPKKFECEKGRNWVYIDANKKAQLIPERKNAQCRFHRINFKQNIDRTLFEYILSFFYSGSFEEELKMGEELPAEMINVRCKDGYWYPDIWETPLISVRKVKKQQQQYYKKWNVLMVSFDSVSQMTFRRKLPKTVRFLEEKLDAVVLNGYNIVGDGTPQAFIPILTGATEEELPLTRKRFPEASFLDDVYPLIWKNYSDAGYVTLFAEDEAFLGMFEYRLKGFRRPPTDHYTRPYFTKLEEKTRNVAAQCIGSDLQHKHWLRYAREFVETYRETPYFGLMHHCVYSHDDINLVGIIDDDLSAWLQSTSEAGLFDDTILIVMADHGHRFAEMRETQQGAMEEKLPFFSITLPKKLRETQEGKQMYANLKTNADRLSSPFDVHQTLHDILQFPKDLTSEQNTRTRSLSLLRPIPSSRTCADADIAPHWCTCLDWKEALRSEEDKQVSYEVAEAIVQAFNEQLQNELKVCSPLKLKGIEYAKKLVPKEDLLKLGARPKDTDGFVPDLTGNTKTTYAHYQIKLSTTPGRGVYEVTVLFDFLTRHLTLDLSSVSHVSPYGDDPHCIIDRNYFLATYCVCYDRV